MKINSETGYLSISTPEVLTDKEYSFYIYYSNQDESKYVQKIIKLKILNWNVDHCQKWTIRSGSACSEWYFGFSLNSGLCIEPSKSAQAMQTSTQSIIASTTGVVVLMSVLNTSSLATLI